ncbi:MAG: VPLPA-CTERM-specific exosortase XrtD [Methylococcaceae bacterium]|jgi:exosortase D (VPLPA-CTERM-specific)
MNVLAQEKSGTDPKHNFVPYFWLFTLILLVVAFRSCLQEMVGVWLNVEEYSHGFFIPVISCYFLWMRRGEFKFTQHFSESWPGLVIVIIGLVIFVIGGLATLKTVEQYAFIITLTGIFTVAFGLKGLRIAGVPLLFLVFMVPFPAFILNNLSSKLQLISSWLGVEFIRACDILVYLEGNVIDLGGYKLQVVDACSGLRYLFPLASLSFLCAYLFKGPFWQKLLIFLSSAPLTIFMNSFRIGVIGVMVQNWGTAMAEGFLHDFEGWIVFLVCMVILFVEMWLLSRLSGRKVAFSELVLIPNEWSTEGTYHDLKRSEIAYNPSIFIVLSLVIVAAVSANFIQGREDIIPERKAFLNFPLQLGSWQGRHEYLDQIYLAALMLTDYSIINYRQADTGAGINFYSAYYQSQRKGVSVHSPKACIPGDGWQITQFGQRKFSDLTSDGYPLAVNRAIIEKGDNRQLVYYWFPQRGRMLTNELLVKWFLFYDSIVINRTDGALVRLVTNLAKFEDPAEADQRLHEFMKELLPVLPAYIPGK